MNKVILIGRLTKNPELRYTPNKKPITSFSIAVKRKFKNANGEYEADFIPIIVWNDAEVCNKYLKQGDRVAIDGRIQIRTYDDEKGYRRYVTEVVAEKVEFLSIATKEDKPKEDDPYDDFGEQIEIEIKEEDLPF